MITVIGRVSVLGGIVNVTMAQRVAIELSVGGILPTMTTVTFTHRTDVYITQLTRVTFTHLTEAYPF